MQSASWSIVMTAMEPRALVLTNLAWHLQTGASEIFLYLDDPDDPHADEYAAIPNVSVTVCDTAHWARLSEDGARSESSRKRQGLNARDGQARARTDWIVHMDADEFLLQDRPLGNELAAARELDCEVYFPPHERVFERDVPQTTLFDGIFRTSTKGLNRRTDGVDNAKLIFGLHHPLLLHGMLGHSAGKCAVPLDSDFQIGTHWAHRGPEGKERAARYKSTSTRLMHFDGMTRLHWIHKILRYAEADPKVRGMSDHRQAQIAMLLEVREDPEAIVELHREIRELDESWLSRLAAFGLLDETRFDPMKAVQAQFGTMPDVSAAAFDRALVAQYPDRLTRIAELLT